MPASHDLLSLVSTLTPIFVLVVLGRFLKRWRVLTPAGITELGRLLFYVCLPALLLHDVSRMDVRTVFEGSAVLACAIAFIVGLAATWWATPHVDPAERGAILNGTVRANGAFIGLPVVLLLGLNRPDLGAQALQSAYAMVLGCMVLVFNVGAVVGFRLPHHGMTAAGWWAVLAELPRNPILLGCGLGVFLGLVQPGCLEGTVPGHTLAMLGAAAVPLALLVTGAQLDLSALRGRPRLMLVTAAVKLLLLPLATWGLCRLFGVSTTGTLAAVILMASPVAMASAPMARQMGGDDRLMAALIVTSTLLAPLSLFVWLAVLTG
jgi:malonate transporter